MGLSPEVAIYFLVKKNLTSDNELNLAQLQQVLIARIMFFHEIVKFAKIPVNRLAQNIGD